MSKGAWSTSNSAYIYPDVVYFMGTSIGDLPSPPASISAASTIAQALSYVINGTVANADKVDGLHVGNASTSTGGHIPQVMADGVMEVGRYIDFHHSLGNGFDYNSRLHTDGGTNGLLFISSKQILTKPEFASTMSGVAGARPAVIELACSGVASSGAAPVVVANRVAVTRCRAAQTISRVRASLDIASTSGAVTFVIKINGVSIFSTNLTIDANELTSKTAAVSFVLTKTSIAEDDEISVDITTSGTAARGAVVAIIGDYL